MNDDAPTLPLIELQDVGFAWPDAAPLLDGIDLRVAHGEKIVLMGANGSGKSTLLKLLAGLVFAQRGHYLHRGIAIDAARMREKAWARRFRAGVGLLFQNPDAMLFNPSVREEIAWGPARLGLPDVDACVAHWADALHLGPLLDQPPFSLSGGQKQKVALACVLALQPGLLLLDEPVANLDPRTAGWLAEHLLDTDATVIVSTHSHSFAAEFGERCVILDTQGRVAHDGPAHAALRDIELLERTHLAYRHRHRHRHDHTGHGHDHEHAHSHPHVHPCSTLRSAPGPDYEQEGQAG